MLSARPHLVAAMQMMHFYGVRAHFDLQTRVMIGNAFPAESSKVA